MKYIRNADGGVHSVSDDFELPQDWAELTEAEAAAANPDLVPDAAADEPIDEGLGEGAPEGGTP